MPATPLPGSLVLIEGVQSPITIRECVTIGEEPFIAVHFTQWLGEKDVWRLFPFDKITHLVIPIAHGKEQT